MIPGSVRSVSTMLANDQSHIHTIEFPKFICFLNQGVLSPVNSFVLSFSSHPLVSSDLCFIHLYSSCSRGREGVWGHLMIFELEAQSIWELSVLQDVVYQKTLFLTVLFWGLSYWWPTRAWEPNLNPRSSKSWAHCLIAQCLIRSPPKWWEPHLNLRSSKAQPKGLIATRGLNRFPSNQNGGEPHFDPSILEIDFARSIFL